MLKRPVTRYWTSAAGGSVPPAGASSLVFLVLSTSDLLLYSVTAFLAWELASNVYSAANAANRAWMRDSVRDDNVGARLDLQTVLAMRSDESGLIDGALVPPTLLVASNQIQAVATLGLAERANVSRIELSLDPAKLEDNLDAVEALNLEPSQLFFAAESTGEVKLSLSQLVRMAKLGGFAEPGVAGGSFAVSLSAFDVLSADDMSVLDATLNTLPVRAEAMVLVQVSDSLGATLRSVHGLMQATDVQLFRLLVTTEEQAQLSMATLPILRNWSDRLQIELAEGIEGLTLVLPSLRQLERVIASPSELLKLAQLGINELALAGSAEGSLKLNLPQWQILDLLSIHIGSDLTLTLMIRETLDLHNLLAKDVGNDVNNATVVVEDLAEVGFKGVQDLVRQGYRISTADADSLNAVALDEAEINAFMSNPAQWIHLLQAAGVQDLDFERPVILSEQATRALLDSNLAAGQTQDVVGTLSAQSAPDDFFDNIGQWMQDKGLDAIEWIRVMTQAPADFVLGQSLAEFSEWALDDSIDVRIEGFLVGIPEYLLLQQSQEWIAHIETNLDVQVVGISDSDITLIQGS